MNPETINAVAQLVAALGVIASLFYLSAQIRQNTRSSRALVVDSLARSMHDLAITVAQNDDLLKVITDTLEDWDGATETERARASSFILGYFKLFENAWFQMQQGTLDVDQWQGYEAFMRNVYGRSGVKIWWPQRRAFFAPKFRDYVEQSKEISDVPAFRTVAQGKV
jgi:hypothetical protein